MNSHLSDDELLDRLYGLSEDSHLDHCEDCARRWSDLVEQRARLAAPEQVSSDILAAQRRRIYARLGEQPRERKAWTPALAAACLVLVGVLLYRPVATPIPDSADDQLFAEVYSMEQAIEPLGATPIHALFEDNQ
jgi:predicted anti-sigma-YlaC factor YlaD